MSEIITGIICFIAGGFVMLTVICCLTVAKRADEVMLDDDQGYEIGDKDSVSWRPVEEESSDDGR